MNDKMPQTPAVPKRPLVSLSVASLYFRGDQLVSASTPDAKLLRPSPGDFADARSTYTKPEWTPTKSDPVSYTRGGEVVVDLVLQCRVATPSKKAKLTKIRGVSGERHMIYERTMNEEITDGQKVIYWLRPAEPIPNRIDRYREMIEWFATIDDQPEAPIERTGLHDVLVTWAQPWGTMDCVPGAFPAPGPTNQDITHERLKLAVDLGQYTDTEKDCVDKVFRRLSSYQSYDLGKRWPRVAPGMTFRHYCWKLVDGTQRGECQMLAAAFVLCCEMLGVTALEVGRTHPYGRRDAIAPHDPRPNPVRGTYNNPDTRVHRIRHLLTPDEDHGPELLCFRDANGGENNFEAVACYRNRFLYGIGEHIPQSGANANENAHLWFQNADFDLYWNDHDKCQKPYPDAVTKPFFKWSE